MSANDDIQDESQAILDVDMGNSRMKWRLLSREGAHIRFQDYGFQDNGFQDNGFQEHGVQDYDDGNGFSFAGLNVVPKRVRVSSVVVDQRRDQFIQHCNRQWYLTPEFARVQRHCGGVTQAYKDPGRLGVDRWLGLLAAFKQHGGCVLVSCGSAVTLDLLANDGRHLGGYIVPGLAMMHRALFTGTDGVKVEMAREFDDLHPGLDTETAVHKGTMAMIKGLVEHGVSEYRAATGASPPLLITGGDGATVRGFLAAKAIYNPYLVLDGLAVALP